MRDQLRQRMLEKMASEVGAKLEETAEQEVEPKKSGEDVAGR